MSLRLPSHTLYTYSATEERPKYKWPGGKELAFYLGLNVEHFAFMSGYTLTAWDGRVSSVVNPQVATAAYQMQIDAP